jgi:hypothetical protein
MQVPVSATGRVFPQPARCSSCGSYPGYRGNHQIHPNALVVILKRLHLLLCALVHPHSLLSNTVGLGHLLAKSLIQQVINTETKIDNMTSNLPQLYHVLVSSVSVSARSFALIISLIDIREAINARYFQRKASPLAMVAFALILVSKRNGMAMTALQHFHV